MQDEGLPPFIAMFASAAMIIGVMVGVVITGAILIITLSDVI